MNRWQAALDQSASANHGLILASDLRRYGIPDRHLDTITRGLIPVRRGAFLAEPISERLGAHTALARAVVSAHVTDVALSHVSAAVVHGFPLVAVNLHEVHVTPIAHQLRGGCRNRVHTHVNPLTWDDVATHDDLTVTSPLRTVVDCALLLPLDSGLVIADYALHEEQISLPELQNAVQHLPRRAGISIARQVAALADPLAESPGESRTRLIVVQGGYEVDSQVDIFDHDGLFIARVDLHLRHHPVVIEFDGRMKYRLDGDQERAHWEEKIRHDRIDDTGRAVVRVIWQELAQPARVLGKVQRAIRRTQRRTA